MNRKLIGHLMNWDHSKIINMIKGQPPGIRKRYIDNMIQDFVRSGRLVMQRSESNSEVARETFVNELIAYLDGEANQNAAKKLRDHLQYCKQIECYYHAIRARLNDSLARDLSPDQFVWSLFVIGGGQILDLHKALLNERPVGSVFLTPRRRTPFQGEEVCPDAYINGLIDPLSTTVKMLGYENKWFEKDTGNLILRVPRFLVR